MTAIRVYTAVSAAWEALQARAADDRGQGTFGYVLLVAGILALVAAFILAINGWFSTKATTINGF